MSLQRAESLTGVFNYVNNGMSQSGWLSASLEMREDGTFCLDLWNLYESWDYKAQDDCARPIAYSAKQEFPQTESEACEIGKRRLRFRGKYAVRKVAAMRLQSFHKLDLNQDFVEDPDQKIAGQPLWWSADGRSFIYFVKDQQQWRANSMRIAGGDGFKAVRPGGSKAGKYYAYSNNRYECLPSPLYNRRWCEVVNSGKWKWPAEVEVPADTVESEAWALDFHADQTALEERYTRGREDIAESRHLLGPITFRGWRHCASGNQLRLVLPPLPQKHNEGDLEIASINERDNKKFQVGKTIDGDPDVLILRASARL